MIDELKQIHFKAMPILWVIGVDVLLIAGTFSSSKIANLSHSIGFFLISLFSVTITTPIIFEVFDFLDPVEDSYFYFHVFAGTLALCFLIYQNIIGIITKVLNISGSKSIYIINSRRIHMITGIVLAILIKVVVYKKFTNEQRTPYVIIDVVLLFIYLYRKIAVSRLVRQDKKISQAQLISVDSLNFLKTQEKKLVVFGNYIYDVSDMTEWHPAGFEIIESVKNTEIEKYLFGIYAPAKVPFIMPHSHSKEALRLLSQPIAKLNILSNFKGVGASNQAKIIELSKISKSAEVYELHLETTSNNLEFLRYTDIKQLGRFYCLTLNDQITRLYTNVNFLNWRNVLFLKQCLAPTPALQSYFHERQCHRESIPILFKHYQNGLLTHRLVEDSTSKLNISEQQGLGLQLNQLPSGQINILTGGTGIYPFLDLLDLIYKHHLCSQKPNLRKSIIEENPLIQSQIFTKFTFQVYAAFQSIQQIHPIVLQQWIELSPSKIIKFSIKIKGAVDRKSYPQLSFIDDKFEKGAQRCVTNNNLSKIFVCGPLRMNEALTEIFQRAKLSEEKFSLY